MSTDKYERHGRSGVALDLRVAADCRKFLSEFKVDCKPVTGCQTADGKWIDFKDATDEQAISFANQIYADFFGGKEGDVTDVHIRTGAN